MTWTAKGLARRLGRRRARPTSAAAFLGRFFVHATVSGSFSGTVGDTSFQSDSTPLHTLVGELGTERNGVYLRPSGRCTACGAIALP